MPYADLAERKAYNKRNHEQNRERRLKYMQQWSKDNPDKKWESNLRVYYKITPEEYIALMFKQGALCAICKQPETTKYRKRTRLLCVDHDHKTGAVRGLLCSDCNHGIGKLKDDPDVLRSALAYLS